MLSQSRGLPNREALLFAERDCERGDSSWANRLSSEVLGRPCCRFRILGSLLRVVEEDGAEVRLTIVSALDTVRVCAGDCYWPAFMPRAACSGDVPVDHL